MSDVLTRLLVLRKVIAIGRKNLPWCGNIAMQKLVYLLESVYNAELGYTYDLHHLGPYSHELASDLSLGEQIKLWRGITVHAVATNNSFSGKQYEECDDADQPAPIRAEAEERWARVESAMSALIKAVEQRTGRDLELLATIHYLRTIQEVPEFELWDVLHALKPKYTSTEFEWGKKKVAEMVEAATTPPEAVAA